MWDLIGIAMSLFPLEEGQAVARKRYRTCVGFKWVGYLRTALDITGGRLKAAFEWGSKVKGRPSWIQRRFFQDVQIANNFPSPSLLRFCRSRFWVVWHLSSQWQSGIIIQMYIHKWTVLNIGVNWVGKTHWIIIKYTLQGLHDKLPE